MNMFIFRCLCCSIDSRVDNLLLQLSFVPKNIRYNYHKFLTWTRYGYNDQTNSGIRRL